MHALRQDERETVHCICYHTKRMWLKLRQFVPNVWDGQNIARVARIGFNFTAQAADVDPDEIDFAVIFRAPDTL